MPSTARRPLTALGDELAAAALPRALQLVGLVRDHDRLGVGSWLDDPAPGAAAHPPAPPFSRKGALTAPARCSRAARTPPPSGTAPTTTRPTSYAARPSGTTRPPATGGGVPEQT